MGLLSDAFYHMRYWGDRLEASVADPKFKELREYAKRMSSLEDEEKAEAPARD